MLLGVTGGYMSGPKTTHRNEWIVESEQFFQDQTRAAQLPACNNLE